MNNKSVSVIIPSKNFFKVFCNTFESLTHQSLLPKEIIVVDSSSNNEIKNYLMDLKSLSISIKYIKLDSAFPGEARNTGLKEAKYDILAILDSKTAPSINWIKNGVKLLDNNDVVFGKTKYETKTKYQKLLRSATHGQYPLETTPGTIFKKKIIEDNNYFISNVRTADDYEWRERLKTQYKHSINEEILKYNSLPLNHISSLKRYFLYSLYTARVNVQKNLKDLYLSIFLLLIFLITPRINYLIGWSETSLLVLNLFQLTFLFLISLVIINLLAILSLKKNNLVLTNATLKIFIYTLIFLIIYNWNTKISKYIFETSLWIPHITKITISLLIFFSFIYRGIYTPLIKGESKNQIFPYNWIIIGLIGFSIDIFKAPGYLLGSLSYFFYNFENKFNNKKKIIFLSPYPFDVQAGQRIKYEKHYNLLEKNYELYNDSFINDKIWNFIYTKDKFILKFFSFVNSSLRRLLILFTIRKYDVVYVHMWINPYFFSFYEKLFYLFSKKIIVDIEDNILTNETIGFKNLNPFSRTKAKYLYQIKNASCVIVSSPYLEKKYSVINKNKSSIYIPPTLDSNIYNAHKFHFKKKQITIGWTGTHSTKKYLKIIEPFLKKIAKIRNIKFIVIGNFDYKISGVDYECIKWNKDTEIYDLLSFDIGLYPLYEEEWSLGKSGLKSLQYMALGIPSISTNYGNSKNIIQNGLNGYLTKNNQWDDYILKLIDSVELRKKIGIESSLYISKNNSIEAINKKYRKVLEN